MCLFVKVRLTKPCLGSLCHCADTEKLNEAVVCFFSGCSLPHFVQVSVSSVLMVAKNHTWYFSSNELIPYSKTNFGEQRSGEISALSEVFSAHIYFFFPLGIDLKDEDGVAWLMYCSTNLERSAS